MARYELSHDIETAGISGGPDALFELGLMYGTGRDVPLDLVEAHKWFNLSALKGNHEARNYRTEIARELTRAEIGRAQRAAREWMSCH
jgi:TPR repeat protein